MQAQQLIGTWLGAALASLALGGCFDGSAADGLPCRTDADCGIGVACQEDPATLESCCGGACSALGGSSSSTGVMSTNSSTSSSTTTVGESSSSDSSSSTSGDACGNGVVEPELGEECEPIEGPCSEDCLLCGNGEVDEGELCDPGATKTPGVTCAENCLDLTLLSWDTTSPAGQEEQDFEFPSFDLLFGQSLQWARGSGVEPPLVSGPYFDPGLEDPDLVPADGWPQSRLLSRTLVFPQLREGDEVKIRIEHAYDFNSDDTPRYFDHGRVDLVRDQEAAPQMWIPLLPERNAGEAVNCEAGRGVVGPVIECFPTDEIPAEPFCDGDVEEWLVGSGSAAVDLPVPWEAVSAQELQVSFRLRYDCGSLTTGVPVMDDAWRLSALVVVVSRPDLDKR